MATRVKKSALLMKKSARVLFDQYDSDVPNGKAGFLCLSALLGLCKDNGLPLRDDQILMLTQTIDGNKTNQIGFEEFEAFWNSDDKSKWLKMSGSTRASVEGVRKYFDSFAPSGFMGKQAFLKLVQDLGKHCALPKALHAWDEVSGAGHLGMVWDDEADAVGFLAFCRWITCYHSFAERPTHGPQPTVSVIAAPGPSLARSLNRRA